MKRLALLGASGHGKVVADTAACLGWSEILFFDDRWPSLQANGFWPVMGDSATLMSRVAEFDGVLVSIGNCSVRWQKHQELRDAGASLVSLVHPSAWVSPHATLGVGSVVMAGAAVNVDACLGQSCIVNTGATIDHDCLIDDGVHVCPGAHLSGNVRVGRCSWVGVGAAVKQGMSIGNHVMVGAGAVVVAPVTDNLTVVGNPARSR